MKIITTRNLAIVAIILIVIILLLLNNNIKLNKFGNPEKDFLSIKLYDKEGNIIDTSDNFAIVNNVPGVAYIDYTITAFNTGDLEMRCTPQNIDPDLFECAACAGLSGSLPAISQTTNNIQAGEKTAWTSNLIPTSQMISITPKPFYLEATIFCQEYKDGAWVNSVPPTKTGSFGPITVNSESGDFTVNVGVGGIPAITSNAKFRTTDLSYVAGSAVGYSDICGNALIAYGYVEESTISQACATKMPTDSYCGSSGNIPLGTLPGGWITGGANPTLWRSATSAGKLCVCDDSGSGTNVVKIYRTSDSDASKINTQARSLDSAKEVAC